MVCLVVSFHDSLYGCVSYKNITAILKVTLWYMIISVLYQYIIGDRVVNNEINLELNRSCHI